MAAFGQLVTGPPGAGKSTYCHGMHQFLTALDRPVHIINLDPAVENPPYPCAINITDLISLQEIMDEHSLGPNGAMLYAMEYLEANIDWLEQELQKLVEEEERGSCYIIIDTPGQVELWTNHDSLKRIVAKLIKADYRLAAVHLSDAHYVTDASKYISVLLLALRAMLQLEIPHVNVLSKMDLITQYGELPFNLEYYTEVQDLSYLESSLETERSGKKFAALNRAICGLIEDYSLVSFETLAVEDKHSMLKLLRLLDRVVGYAYIPRPKAGSTSTEDALGAYPLPQLTGVGDVRDVQEKWVDNRREWEEWEMERQSREARDKRTAEASVQAVAQR
ncbi:hypothetical protein NCC49_005898 [Naganishia albida]|nr:hypothetical protein NCC49_005898 [Naganishia albida]